MSEAINNEYRTLLLKETFTALTLSQMRRMNSLRWQSTLNPWEINPPEHIVEYRMQVWDVTEGVLLWSEGKVETAIMLAACKNYLDASETWGKERDYSPGHPWHGKYQPHPLTLLELITLQDETRRFLAKHIDRVEQGEYPEAIEGRKEAFADYLQSKWPLWPRMINNEFCEVSARIDRGEDYLAYRAVREIDLPDTSNDTDTGEPGFSPI